MKVNLKIFRTFLFVAVGVSSFTACKKYDNPPPVFEDIKDFNGTQRKVIVISIDGLSGEELQKAVPTNLAALQKNSKYSFNTLPTTSNAAGWVSMLTGTGFSKHQTSADNFERTEHGDDEEHGEIVNFRNVLDYVTQYKSVSTAMVTTWDELRNYVRNADYAPAVNSDLAVKDSTISLLSKVNSLGTIMVNLRDVQKAGEDGGYTINNAKFKSAIVKSDEYIGNIVEAIKARKNYTKEDWLVVVTTNHGGSNSDAKNGFTIVSQPDLKEYELKKSGFNPVLFNTSTSRAVLNDKNIYDAGETKSFSVQMDVKFSLIVPNGYASFFGRSTNLGGQVITGWQWAHYPGGKWVITVGGSANGGGGKSELSSKDAPGTTSWRTLTMVIEYVNSTTRNLIMYMDGVKQAEKNISAQKSLSTTEMLRVGHRDGDNTTITPFYGANLTYFNTALTENDVTSTIGLKDITKHPKYANVIGFWPMDEGSEGTFFNKAPGGLNMTLSGDYKWTYLEDDYAPGTEAVPITAKISIPTATSDIAALCLYWMNIEILADFNYDGKPYLNNFELEFLKD